jgi:hypothetical protein
MTLALSDDVESGLGVLRRFRTVRPAPIGMWDSDSELGGMSDSGSGMSDEGFCGTGTGSCERLVAAILGHRRVKPRHVGGECRLTTVTSAEPGCPSRTA